MKYRNKAPKNVSRRRILPDAENHEARRRSESNFPQRQTFGAWTYQLFVPGQLDIFDEPFRVVSQTKTWLVVFHRFHRIKRAWSQITTPVYNYQELGRQRTLAK